MRETLSEGACSYRIVEDVSVGSFVSVGGCELSIQDDQTEHVLGDVIRIPEINTCSFDLRLQAEVSGSLEKRATREGIAAHQLIRS